MKVYALVGPTGTGKSYRAPHIAQRYGIDCIIDDGLLISQGSIIAGKSSKAEVSKIKAAKIAVFYFTDHRQQIIEALKKIQPPKIMILGISLAMVEKICERLQLPYPSEIVMIEDIASPEAVSYTHLDVYKRQALVTRAIEGAQKKVEGYHFNIRKTLLQYDDVMNKQREVIYNQRRTLLAENNLRPLIFGMLNDVVHECVSAYAAEKTYPEEWDWDGFDRRLFDLFGFGHGVPMKQRPQAKPEDLERLIITRYKEIYEQKVSEVNDQVFREVERFVGLRVVDGYWKEQLHNMDHLREGIGPVSYTHLALPNISAHWLCGIIFILFSSDDSKVFI